MFSHPGASGLCRRSLPWLNNTIYHSFEAISLFVSGGGTIHVLSEFKNNAIYMTAGTAFANPNSWAPTSAAQVDYNSIYLTGGAAAYSGTHASWNANTVSTDPLFVSVGTDYHLQSGSPLIDAGTTIASVTTDKDGVARPQGSAYDIGAYEVSGSAAPAAVAWQWPMIMKPI